jgi:hypothetical protein
MNKRKKNTIFLCCANDDRAVVKNIYRWLLKMGLQPWLDEENILPGQDWNQEIKKAIENSLIVLVCISNKSVTTTGHVQKEIKYALDVADQHPFGEIFLIPARLENCVVPRQLSKYQWVDLFEEKGFDKLLKAVRFISMEEHEAENSVLGFVEELYLAKGYKHFSPEKHDEIIKDLLQKVHDFLLAKSIAALSDKDALALSILLDQKVSDERIQEFFSEKIPNTPDFIASVLHEFRRIYLNLPT